MENAYFLTAIILVLCSQTAFGQHQQEPINYNILVQALQNGVEQLGEKLKVDLTEKYLKLSSQLDDNDRKVGKTLSLFEREWREKSERLNKLEERQSQVETSIQKITRLLNELKIKEPTTPRPSTTTTVRPLPSVTSALNDWKQRLIKFSPIVGPAVRAPVPTSTDYYVQTQTTYYVHGSEAEFKTLRPIPLANQLDLSSIELHFVNVDPAVLVKSLHNCSKLRSLRLLQVNLTRDFEPWDRVVLPYLQEFVFEQIGVLQYSNETIFSKWTEIDDFLKSFHKGTLKSLIFFDKNDIQTWEVDRISGLGTNIDVLIDGIRVFRIDHEAGEISSMLKYSNDFIEKLDGNFRLRSLAVSLWRPDLDTLPLSLRSLNFNYVLGNNEAGFEKKLERLRSLEDLNIFVGNQGSRGWRLALLPPVLKNLTIRYSDIRNFPKATLLRLDNLNLYLCQFDQYFAQDFPNIFEAINVSVTFRMDFNSSGGLHHLLLQSILRTPASRILLQNFNRQHPQVLPAVYENMELFLGLCGIPKGAQHFVLEMVNGEWHGRGLSPEEQLLEIFYLVGTHKFVTFDSYKRITA